MKRELYIDQAKGIGLLMVILMHISGKENCFLVFGNSFKLVIFYIISGYLFSSYYNPNISLKTFVTKKLKSFGIPYLFFSILFIFISFLLSLNKGNFCETMQLILEFISLKGISTLWFLPSLFLVEISYFTLKKYQKEWINIGLIIISFMLILFMGFGRINIWTLFGSGILSKFFAYLIGVLIKGIIALGFFSFSVTFSKRIIKISKLYFILMIMISFILSQLNYGIDFNNIIFGQRPILFIVCSLCASYGIIGILKQLNIKKEFLLNFLGFNSLFIMCTHLMYITPLILKLFNIIIAKLNISVLHCFEILVCFLLIVFVEYILIKFWKYFKNNFLYKTKLKNFFKYI